MNPERQVAKLEGLLERIKRNAVLPRPVAVASAAAHSPAMTAAPGTTRAAPPPPAAPLPAAPPLAAAPSPVVELPEPEPLAARAPTPERVEPPAPAIDELDDFGDLEPVEPLSDDLDLDEAEDLELIDDEIIDITDLDDEEAAAIEAEAAEAEGAPSSSPRPKAAAASMDEALASAAAQMDGDREVPLKTPPPESGDQVATPVGGGPLRHRPPADDLLEVGDELPQRDFGAGPTPEQLGETIDLDEPLGPALELDTAKAAPPPVPEAPSPLEEPIVSAAAGTFDADLELPPEAAADLAKHRARGEAEVLPEPMAPPAASTLVAGEVRPEVVQRPAVAAGLPPAYAAAAQSFQPRSFGELLDASLSL